ncbi:MAG TPA: hypothetical protein DHW63_04710 [Hyphomonadaceae bacterium]|nr:hypothetical protein [Hyphomonadaceae bacterium]
MARYTRAVARNGYVRRFIDLLKAGDELINIGGPRAALAGLSCSEAGGGGGQNSSGRSDGGVGAPG